MTQTNYKLIGPSRNRTMIEASERYDGEVMPFFFLSWYMFSLCQNDIVRVRVKELVPDIRSNLVWLVACVFCYCFGPY